MKPRLTARGVSFAILTAGVWLPGGLALASAMVGIMCVAYLAKHLEAGAARTVRIMTGRGCATSSARAHTRSDARKPREL